MANDAVKGLFAQARERRRPRADPAQRGAGRRRHEGDRRCLAAGRLAAAGAAIPHPRLSRCYARLRCVLRDALGAKKLKELRRQRHRLAEHGAVHFEVARTPEDVADAIEDIPDAGSQRLEGPARHRAGAGRWRCQLRAARHRGARRDPSMRDRDLAGRRYPGRGRDRIAASGSRVLFQARHRRAFRKVFARRPVDARSDSASLRRPGDCERPIPPRMPIIR